MLKVRSLLYAGHIPVDILQPAIQAWVSVADTSYHELEMLLVYSVESDEGGVEFDIDLRHIWSWENIRAFVFC